MSLYSFYNQLTDLGVQSKTNVDLHSAPTLTAVQDTHYLLDTTANSIVVTLPLAPTNGDVIGFSDYTSTFASNNVTIQAPLGFTIADGVSTQLVLDKNYAVVELAYWDSNWSITKSQYATGNTYSPSEIVDGVNLDAVSSELADKFLIQDVSDADTLKVTTAISLKELIGGLEHFGENKFVTDYNLTKPTVHLYLSGVEPNLGLVLSPKGDGAFTVQVPDGLVDGGNNRGAHSVDFQSLRTVSTQVASGDHSALLGGANNTASAMYSTAVGGNTNVASGDNSVVVGGINAVSSALNSAVVAGDNNTASALQSVVVGGTDNSSSSLNSAVVGGNTNTASGDNSSAISGSSNTVSGINSAVVGGNTNDVTGDNSVAVVGDNNVVSGASSSTLAGSTNTVSSVNSAVVAGSNNDVAGVTSAVVAGDNNTVTVDAVSSATVAGIGNTISGDSAAALAGDNNTVSGLRAASVGGITNQAVGVNSVVTGNTNVSTADNSAVLAGDNNNSSGANSVVIGGSTNTASGVNSVALGGTNNDASGDNSVALGVQADTNDVSNKLALSSGAVNAAGDSQYIVQVFRGLVADGLATPLTADLSNTVSSTNSVALSTNGVITLNFVAQAHTAANTKLKTWNGTVTVYKENVDADTAVVTPVFNSLDVIGAPNWSLQFVADASNSCGYFEFTNADTVENVLVAVTVYGVESFFN